MNNNVISISNLTPGCIVLIYANDMEFEAKQVANLLYGMGFNNLVTMEDIQPAFLSSPSDVPVYEAVYHNAAKFLIIMSKGLAENSGLRSLLDMALDGAIEQKKLVIPLKFSREHHGLIYLNQFGPVQLYTSIQDEAAKRAFIARQIENLAEVLSE